jgi:hypothetical protein
VAANTLRAGLSTNHYNDIDIADNLDAVKWKAKARAKLLAPVRHRRLVDDDGG